MLQLELPLEPMLTVASAAVEHGCLVALKASPLPQRPHGDLFHAKVPPTSRGARQRTSNAASPLVCLGPLPSPLL